MNRQPASLKLPPECVLRKACATDAEAIKSLVSTERVNPTQLYWLQF
ncbi:hypothetical protein NIES4071_108180 (plasmid) [Calothrix sp. NIES-4071]|nr:hypothetical protein NIES4071_108180 [Calothrix sp. NIES-4071]BAZ64858.1 hypothetical protein NIES4105_105910 [Calothrix sp. NIES-4105]